MVNQTRVPAAKYVRMSTEHQQYSIENQSLAIQKYADTHGFEIVATYSDSAKSGLVLRRRPESTCGVATSYYDALNRPCLIVPQDGTLPSSYSCPATSPGNDVLILYSGNCTTVTDEAGKQRESCADGLDRATGVWEDPNGLNYATRYSYDALNNLKSVTQSGSRQRAFTYDSLSRLTISTNPESGTTCYGTVPNGVCQQNGYDANGNMISKTAPKENQTNSSVTVTTTYSYDDLNRLTQKSYSDGTTLTCTYTLTFTPRSAQKHI